MYKNTYIRKVYKIKQTNYNFSDCVVLCAPRLTECRVPADADAAVSSQPSAKINFKFDNLIGLKC